MKTPRPNYKSSLLLAWIIGFTALNIWFMRLSSFNALSRTEFKSRSNWVVDNNSNARIGVYDSMMDDDQMGYDDDNHRTYSADFEALPQWEDSADALPNQQAERGGELSALKELAGGKRGKIAWLMSFPNSGTSFTSLLIRHATNATTASNYGMECNPGEDGKSVPVHEWSSKGPYWLHPPTDYNRKADQSSSRKQIISSSGTETGKSGSYSIPPSGASILTKTHCGSRCTFCPPERYLETWQSFLINCLSGARSVPIKEKRNIDSKSLKNANSGYQKEYVTYHPSLVEKAVHLIRNPFDNLVSRFHHEQKEHKKRHDNKWTDRYTNDAHGFRKWCADEDMLFRSKEQKIDWESMGYNARQIHMHFEGVACHAEFFRYAQWHNYAIEAVHKLEIPVLYVHYEDYTTNLARETDRMLEFLNMTRIGKLPTFDSNKDYSAYFSLEERAAASELMRVVASDDGKKLMERYWVELDYRAMRKQIQAILD